MEEVEKKGISGKIIVLGIFLATFFCSFSGQINDLITVKYLPEQFAGDSVMFGFTFSAFSLGKILTMISFAKLSDRIGRKKGFTSSVFVVFLRNFFSRYCSDSTSIYDFSLN